MRALKIQNMIEFPKLRNANGGVELAEAKIRSDVRVLVRSSIGTQMIVAMISEGLC